MRKLKIIWVTLVATVALFFVLDNAAAYRPGGQKNTIPTTLAVTVGTSSAQAMAADTGRSALYMCNASSTATVFWTHNSFGAAAMNTAGSLPLPAQSCMYIDNTKDTDAINMIASAASTPVTIVYWD